MKTENEMNEKILRLTDSIRNNYPELLQYLNEMPETIPDENNPEISAKTLSSYYDSLSSLLQGHINSHLQNVSPAKFIINP